MNTSRPVPLAAGMNMAPAWIGQSAGAVLTPLPFRPSALDGLPRHRLDQRMPEGRFIEKAFATALVANDATELPLTVAAVQRQLISILQSKAFIQSAKLSRFLGFVVEQVLNGTAGCLKEYLIGVEVYNRKPPYDPSQDSIVRTEARRLRSKLKEYYEAEGLNDSLYIYLRPGSYVPLFQSREDEISPPTLAETKASPLPKSSSIVTAILPFRDISGNTLSSTYARGIPDELAFILMKTYGCSILPPSKLATLGPQQDEFAELMQRAGAHIAFEGSVRVEGPHLRVTARILDARGSQLWLKRIDVEVGTTFSFTIEEQIASTLAAGMDVARTADLTHAQRSSTNRHL
jgi:TolB-like protein